jgi:hypothetical protein
VIDRRLAAGIQPAFLAKVVCKPLLALNAARPDRLHVIAPHAHDGLDRVPVADVPVGGLERLIVTQAARDKNATTLNVALACSLVMTTSQLLLAVGVDLRRVRRAVLD